MSRTKLLQSVLAAAVTLSFASSSAAETPAEKSHTENDSNAVAQFRSLLDQTRDKLNGCQGQWRGKTGEVMSQIMCQRFDGPGAFKGAGTTVVLLGERISMVASQLKSSSSEQAQEHFRTLKKQLAPNCELSEESDRQAKYTCDGHRISVSYSRAGGEWQTSLTVASE